MVWLKRNNVASLLAIITSAVFIHRLPFACCSPLPAFSHLRDDDDNRNNQMQLSPKMTYEATLHGLLLWASMGFLMPVGVLIIRFSNREKSITRLKLYFYFHLFVQMLSVSLATTGAIKSIKTFENSFSNNHQRIGLALYVAIWVQLIIGFCRPQRGTKKRTLWYFVHWVFGTSICIVGIVNIYTGLAAYKKRTKRSVTIWTVVFTAEISSIAFFYLFQDKWDYMQKQGPCLSETGQVRPSDDPESPSQKDIWREPCSKVNALKNLFS